MKDVNQMDSKEIFESVASGEMEGQELVVQNKDETVNTAISDNLLFQIGLQSGKAQMSKAISRFADVAYLDTLRKAKEAKEYKGLKGIRLGDGTILTGTWTEFCQLIGSSRRTVDERLANLVEFGEKALESMQAVGMGVRDLRKLRALPEDAQKTIIEGVKEKGSSFDKEELLDLMEEQAVKHRDECNKLNDKIIASNGKLKAVDQLLEQRNKRLNEIEKELAVVKGEGSPAKTQQLIEEKNKLLSQALINAKFNAFSAFAEFKDAVVAIQEGEHPTDLYDAYHNAMFEIVEHLVQFSSVTGLDQTVYQAVNSEFASSVLDEE